MIYFKRAVETNPTGRVIMAKGGRGDIASSPESKNLDTNTKKAMKNIISSLLTKYELSYGHTNRVTKNSDGRLDEFVSLGISLGCVPDGGMWFEKKDGTRKLRFVFESKHQGKKGNAIERWGKNYILCKMLNPEVKYVTFLTGEGCQEGEILYRFAKSMEVLDPKNTLFHSSENGFTQDQIESIMKSYLHKETE